MDAYVLYAPFNAMTPFAELVNQYPGSEKAAERAAKARIKELRKLISSLSDFRAVWMSDINKMHFKQQPGMIVWLNKRIDDYYEDYAKEIRREEYKLNWLSNKDTPDQKRPTSGVTEEQIAQAKQFPIGNLIKVNRAHKALCPFHAEKTPSFTIYKDNRGWCFGEGKGYDAIDVYRELNGCDFITAVKALSV